MVLRLTLCTSQIQPDMYGWVEKGYALMLYKLSVWAYTTMSKGILGDGGLPLLGLETAI